MDNIVLQLQTAPATESATESGMTTYRKELIRVGQYVKDSIGLAFEVTRETLKHWVDTFDRWTANGNKVPIPLGHGAADKPEANQGWVKQMVVDGDSLFGTMELKDRQLALTTDVSIFVPGEHVDGRGNKYTQPIAHVALCTDPVIPGLKGFEQLSLSLGDSQVDKKKVAKLLGLAEDTDEAGILAAIVKATKKAPDKSLALTTTSTPASGALVKLVVDNRNIKVGALVKAGVITPAIETAIKEQYTKAEPLALSLSGGWDDGFDFLVRILTENKTVPLGEKSAAQLLELANTRAQGEQNPIAADVNRRRAEAGMDKS